MENFLIENNIKHVKSRPHHPQTNGALERYHREIDKFLYDKIKNLSEFGDNEIEEGILEYISYHNNKKKLQRNLHLIKSGISLIKIK